MVEGHLCLDGACLGLLRADGHPVSISSIKFNAAISALELRAPRIVGAAPQLLGEIGTGPLWLTATYPIGSHSETWRIDFEKAVLGFPLEWEGGELEAVEVVILRGLRIDVSRSAPSRKE